LDGHQGEEFTVGKYRKSYIRRNAEERRANPTPAEVKLLSILYSLKGGVLRSKFKREHPVSGKWIVDFFFPEVRLAIEVDGPVHDTEVQRAKDLEKDCDCKRFDITVLRLRNDEIFGDHDTLVEKLRAGYREAKYRENRIVGKSALGYGALGAADEP
jgi:very-short-patch-repair endonuclease